MNAKFQSIMASASRTKPARRAAAGAIIGITVMTSLSAAAAASAVPLVITQVGCSVTALNAAIKSAASGGTLELAQNCTYTTKNPLTVITQNLTIEGGNDTIRFAGTGHATIMTVARATVTLDQIDLADGDGSGKAPGALRNNAGHVTITNSVFRDNHGAAGGGAILNKPGGTLSVRNSSFFNNDAGQGGGAIANQGAASSLTVTEGQFVRSSAPVGGAIWIQSGTATFGGGDESSQVTFSDNRATSGAGGAILNAAGSLTVRSARFSGNSASGGGGAIRVMHANSRATNTIDNATLTHNSAGTSGGGLSANKTVSLTGDTFTSNHADADGGGIYVDGGHVSLTSTTVTQNTADSSGGGIYRNSGTVQISADSSVTQNLPNDCTNVTC